MNAACEDLTGERDFRAFTSQPEGPFGCHLLHAGWSSWAGGFFFQARSDRFLYRMVRFLVGACIEVGRGNRPIGYLREILATGDRSRAPGPAPAHGVYLLQVGYGAEWRREERPVAGPFPFEL
jgi:tRNA pseudouridine38-40 synthase